MHRAEESRCRFAGLIIVIEDSDVAQLRRFTAEDRAEVRGDIAGFRAQAADICSTAQLYIAQRLKAQRRQYRAVGNRRRCPNIRQRGNIAIEERWLSENEHQHRTEILTRDVPYVGAGVEDIDAPAPSNSSEITAFNVELLVETRRGVVRRAAKEEAVRAALNRIAVDAAKSG
ncbi:MAG: hypothetical protein M5U16_04255 [Hyphomicrobium sp.]|nr:hypothetical protein [Hyphomicrobium sp.]MCZ7594200.1 hypothetical protein [Hyphomicrobium sp.]